MAEKQISILLVAKDMASKTIGKVNKDLGKLGRTGANFDKVGKGLATIGAVAGGAVAVGLYKSAEAAINWQDAFQGVIKTVDETDLRKSGSSFDKLGMNLRDMAREMPNTAIELAGIAEQAGALGIKAADIEAFTRQVAILASTTNVSADEAATSLGQLQNVIGLTGADFDNFAASLVDLGNKGASTEASILDIAKRSGAAGKLFGIAKEETLGWAAAAANLGMNEELAGTALQTLFLKSMPQFTHAGKTMQKLLGKNAKQIAKAYKEDAGGSLESLIGSLRKLPKAARLETIQKLFGKTSGLTRLVLGLSESVDTNLTPSLDTAATSWESATAAQVEFDKRTQTVKSQLQILKNNVTDAAISVGEGFAPAIGRAAAKLSEFLKVPGNRSALQDLGKDIGRMIDGVDWGGLIRDARSFMSALEKAGGFARGLWDAFMSMPTEVKAILISLAGLEKVSGGAVSSIVGELGKGLIKGVLGITAGVVNVNGGVVNGGGGNPLPAGAGAAGSAGLSGALMAVIAPASIIALGVGVENALLRGVPEIVKEIWGVKPEEGVNNTSARDPGFQAQRQVNALLANVPRKIEDTTAAIKTMSANDKGEQAKLRSAVDGVKSKTAEAIVAFRTAERTFAASQGPPIVNLATGFVTVKVAVSAANVSKSVTIRNRYTGTSSRTGNSRTANQPI
jgi:TP901 family phage tail tape measure protein